MTGREVRGGFAGADLALPNESWRRGRVPVYQRTLQNVLRNEVVAIGIPHNFEPDFLADGPHGDVIGENVGGGGNKSETCSEWGVGELLFINQVDRLGG